MAASKAATVRFLILILHKTYMSHRQRFGLLIHSPCIVFSFYGYILLPSFSVSPLALPLTHLLALVVFVPWLIPVSVSITIRLVLPPTCAICDSRFYVVLQPKIHAPLMHSGRQTLFNPFGSSKEKTKIRDPIRRRRGSDYRCICTSFTTRPDWEGRS